MTIFNRKSRARSRKSSLKRRQNQSLFHFESLEPRVVLSAESLCVAPAVTDLNDSGFEVHALTALPNQTADPANPQETLSTTTPVSLAETFYLNSNPNADHTIYLDFDGHVTSGTIWNSNYNGGQDIVTAAYDFDGNTSSFSNTELQRIQWIWERVAEDFIPFDVNVTTQDPGTAALTKSGSGDSQWGGRLVIGGSSSDWWGSAAGGVAYVSSFNWSSDSPGFVFEAQLGNGNEKYTAEAISHEAGHMLGLSHDGRLSPSEAYFSGHGSGETGWAPIMGSGYYKNVTQWSKGEYTSASQTQNDLAILTSNNGFSYRADDHGSNHNSATSLDLSNETISDWGIIEQSSDVDVFAFTTNTGTLQINADPLDRGPNLDVILELFDSASNLVAVSNPGNELSAVINISVAAGQYFLHVSGGGNGDPASSGYSDYASLGQYFLSGNLVPAHNDFLSISGLDASKAEGNTDGANLTFVVNRTGNTSTATTVDYAVAGSGSSAADASDFAGSSLPTGSLSFAAGETSKTITVQVSADLDVENDEGFTVTLSNATGDTVISDANASGLIVNDDVAATPGILSISGLDTSKAEGNTDGANLTFVVNRTGDTSTAISVDYGVAGSGSSAADASDFVGGLPTGSLSFAAGETSKTITVQVSADLEIENDEGFTVTLANATGDTVISEANASGLIVNDDVAATPGIIVTPTSGLTTNEQGTSASFTVVLESRPTADVTINVTSLDTTEGTVSINQLRFTTDNWSTAQVVTVTGVDDTVRDRNVSYTVELGASQSSDANYNGLAVDDVQLTNQDNDKRGGRGKKGGKKAQVPNVESTQLVATPRATQDNYDHDAEKNKKQKTHRRQEVDAVFASEMNWFESLRLA